MTILCICHDEPFQAVKQTKPELTFTVRRVQPMKKILITGGTSGIGLELVKYFDKGDYQVYFTAKIPKKGRSFENISSRRKPVWLTFHPSKASLISQTALKKRTERLMF